MAGDDAKASADLLERGRNVVDRLVAGDIASVYEQFSPQLKAQASLAEVKRTIAEERARAPIGSRLEERVIPFGGTNGAYFADHAKGDGRRRFRVSFDPDGRWNSRGLLAA